jgi:hypothetical protein
MNLSPIAEALDRHLPFAGRVIGPLSFLSFMGYIGGAFLLGIATDFLSYRVHRAGCRLVASLRAERRRVAAVPELRPTTRCDITELAALRAEAARTERSEATTLSMPAGWTPPLLPDDEARAERAESETVSLPRPAAGEKSAAAPATPQYDSITNPEGKRVLRCLECRYTRGDHATGCAFLQRLARRLDEEASQ